MWSRKKIKKNRKRKKFSSAKTVRLEFQTQSEDKTENILIGSSSIVGSRKEQQDAMLAEKNNEKNYIAAVLCDGMGGMQGGAVASNTAVKRIVDGISNIIDMNNLQKEMLRIIRDADRAIYGLKDSNGNYLRAGTTAVAVLVKDGTLNWVSVGDSKLFLIRNSIIKTLTNEHNYAFMSRQKQGQADFVFDPNVRQDALVSYLGAGDLAYVDTNLSPLVLLDGDVILLCSDGLYKNLSEELIKEILSREDNIDNIAENLTQAASQNAKGSLDNTTVIVLKYKFN